MQLNAIKRVVISVTDKKGIDEFARELSAFGAEILSTGGTAAQLRKSGIPVTEVSDYTGFPEMMDGRVKTLHPKIHGGLLALRDNDAHVQALREHGISPIDMVVINLYRFEDTIAREGCTLEHAIENIDIGGPTMLRRLQELPLRVRRNRPAGLSEDHRGTEADGGEDLGSDELRAGKKDISTHGPLRRRHLKLPRKGLD